MSKIMLIEDQRDNARLATKLLQKAGHQVVVAEDGESGLELVKETAPDLILADFGLPDMDGLTMVSFMRNVLQLTQVPIIAFTAWPRATVSQLSESYGCQGVITKPINTRTFVKEVENYLTAKQN